MLTRKEGQPTTFHFVRDYEVVKVEQEVPNEFLLVLDDGDGDVKDFTLDATTTIPSQPRARGAYYKNIERKMLLKKKRVNVSISFAFVILQSGRVLTRGRGTVVRPSNKKVAHGQTRTQ